VCLTYKGNIVIIGGQNHPHSCEIYDVYYDTWSEIAQTNIPRPGGFTGVSSVNYI